MTMRKLCMNAQMDAEQQRSNTHWAVSYHSIQAACVEKTAAIN